MDLCGSDLARISAFFLTPWSLSGSVLTYVQKLSEEGLLSAPCDKMDYRLATACLDLIAVEVPWLLIQLIPKQP